MAGSEGRLVFNGDGYADLPEGAGEGVTDMVVLWGVISHACAVARMAGRSGANEAGGARA